jgi:hypothetical protein
MKEVSSLKLSFENLGIVFIPPVYSLIRSDQAPALFSLKELPPRSLVFSSTSPRVGSYNNTLLEDFERSLIFQSMFYIILHQGQCLSPIRGTINHTFYSIGSIFKAIVSKSNNRPIFNQFKFNIDGREKRTIIRSLLKYKSLGLSC